MLVRVLSHADLSTKQSCQLSAITEPSLVRLTYEDVVVVAVVEAVEDSGTALIVQYTVDDGRPNADTWTALLRFHDDTQDWTVEVPVKDGPYEGAITGVCLDLLCALHEGGADLWERR